jgi:hypothetical protein
VGNQEDESQKRLVRHKSNMQRLRLLPKTLVLANSISLDTCSQGLVRESCRLGARYVSDSSARMSEGFAAIVSHTYACAAAKTHYCSQV